MARKDVPCPENVTFTRNGSQYEGKTVASLHLDEDGKAGKKGDCVGVEVEVVGGHFLIVQPSDLA